MAAIVVRRHHALGLAKAKDLAQSIARRLQDDFGGSFGWHGDVLHFERTGASGSVAVSKEGFEVQVQLGFLLSPLRWRIEQGIVDFCDEHFAGNGAGRDQPARRAARRRRDTKSSWARLEAR